jgi:hypothetical protein
MRAASATLAGLLGLGYAVDRQAEGNVFAHRHVRKDRVGLEHHGDAAVLGLLSLTTAVDFQRARGDVLEPRDHPQKRGLATAGRADEDDEFAILDVDIDALDHLDRAEALATYLSVVTVAMVSLRCLEMPDDRRRRHRCPPVRGRMISPTKCRRGGPEAHDHEPASVSRMRAA